MRLCTGKQGGQNILFKRELAEINITFGGGDQVEKLAHLGLIGRLVEEFKEIDVVRLMLEVHFQQMVNSGFQHEGVVDGDHPDLGYAVPAWLGATGNGRVHDIV